MTSIEQREVIAHFSRRFLAWGMLILAFLIWFFLLAWQDAFSGAPGIEPRRHWDAVAAVLVLPIGLVGVGIVMARSAYFAMTGGGSALWIEAGRLVCADRKKLDVALDDVTSIDLIYPQGGIVQFVLPKLYPVLLLRLKSGTTARLPLNPFRERP